mmetsp:Transcript_19209/g.27042  ORF Transcript_19209/g.27042 Transcript_19209/m.27042 type:complete len:107 (+) Transcript_19209:1876-2196(+)
MQQFKKNPNKSLKIFSSSDNECEIKNTNIKNYLKQPNKRFSYPFISKFEKAKLLGIRAKQISNGNPPTVPLEGESDPLLIALKEYRENKIPLKIRRFFSDGRLFTN